jgi:hypothetical protein
MIQDKSNDIKSTSSIEGIVQKVYMDPNAYYLLKVMSLVS